MSVFVKGGGGENVTPEVTEQSSIIDSIMDSISGKVVYSKEGVYVWKKLTAEGGDFIEYVVSNVDSTYPDGGEQDGYWYERFALDASLFGCTKYAVDKFTFAERTAAGGVEITHSLGEIPKISLLLISSSVTTGSSSDLFYWFCDYRLGVEGSSNLSLGYYNAVYGYLTTSTNGLTKTSDSVAISTSGVYYQAGAEYTLISMA